jgi:hypothetical protein
VSDKRLLERYGTGKGYLNETQSGSVRPPGLHIKRAEAWTKGTRSQTDPGCTVGRRKPETFFQRLSHRASGKQRASAPSQPETGARSSGKCAPEPEGHFVPESLSQDGKKGQPEGYAVTSKTGKPRVAGIPPWRENAAGQNNSNPTPLTASAVNGGWELLFVNSSHYCFIYFPSLYFHLSTFIFFLLSFIFDLHSSNYAILRFI